MAVALGTILLQHQGTSEPPNPQKRQPRLVLGLRLAPLMILVLRIWYRVKVASVCNALNAVYAVLLTSVRSVAGARRMGCRYVVLPLTPEIGLKLIAPIQCIGSKPCLRCIEVHGACSYENSLSIEDECAGKNLLELKDSLEVLKDDGSVPLARRITFALLW